MSKKPTVTTTLTKADHRKNISAALVALAHAQVAACRAIAAAMPKGGEIIYDRRGPQTGRVLYTPDPREPSRIKVENIYTGKSYWIWLGDVRGFENVARAGWDIGHAYDREIGDE